MATWSEFCTFADAFGGRQLNESAWIFELPGNDIARTQKVFAFHEILEPDFEFLQVKSAFTPIATINAERVLRRLGQMQAGAIGYTPAFDGLGNPIDGHLNLSTSIPLAALDLSDPRPVFLYLNIVAQSADVLEQQIATAQTPDHY